MQVFRARLGRARARPANSMARGFALASLVALAAATRASEEGGATAVAFKSGKEKTGVGSSGATERPASTRVAAVDKAPQGGRSLKTTTAPIADASAPRPVERTPIERAIQAIADCQARYELVDDYTCTFYKRERIAGRMTPLHIMAMKVRTNPNSIYLKFQQPAQGREAIYIAGRHGSKVLAHDVGFNKILAGTLTLDPTSTRAMEDCRHPITEAGIGPLLDTLAKRWAVELNPDETRVVLRDDMLVGERRCTMIETRHPQPKPHFTHHLVRVYIDQELGLPIRFEAFDWVKHPGAEPELTEEYSYSQLKMNVGLRDIDFDPSNSAYSFGRF